MTKFMTVNCGICGSTNSEFLRQIRGLKIVQCKDCGCIYTNPRRVWNYDDSDIPLQEKLSIYQQHYWPKRKVSANRFWNESEKYRRSGTLLEVGCGFGHFINESRLHGWSVTGVEIAHDEASWGREHFNLNIIHSIDDAQLDGLQFDIITLWDVIEHVPDVLNLVHRCFDLLRPGGVLFIKTPNADGLVLKPTWWSSAYLSLYWQLVYPANPNQHIYHFTPAIMKKLLYEIGFVNSSLETYQDWNERILVGRNPLVTLVRKLLMWISWKTHLPYEMTIWAKKN